MRFLCSPKRGNALIAEATALLIGLELVWDRGHRHVMVEVDCGELLQAMEDEESCRFLPILNVIRSFKTRDWSLSIHVARRECNAPADSLAKTGVRSALVDVCFLEDPPPDVETLVLMDSLFVR